MALEQRVIGALAADIRGDWSHAVDTRIDTMIQLCQKVSEAGWIKKLKSNRGRIKQDGRWFRDSWDGPYGGTITYQELESLGLTPHDFNYPEDAISDFID